jgi:hypothetical protein
MMGLTRKTDPTARFIGKVKELVSNQSRPPMVIPVLAADPPTTDPTNLWLLTDGRLRSRYWNGTTYIIREYTPVTPTGTTPPAYVPQGAAATTQEKLYTATWSQSYVGAGTPRAGDGETLLYYGNQQDGTGRNKALIGFNAATIAADLAGADIRKVQLVFNNIRSVWGTGAEVHFGIHNSTTEPATWPSIPRSMITAIIFGSSQTATVDLTTEFGTAIRDGIGKGIAVEAPSDDAGFAGVAAGVGSGYTTPQLIVTYVK